MFQWTRRKMEKKETARKVRKKKLEENKSEDTTCKYETITSSEDGQDQENLNGENGEENDPIFKVPSLPPDNAGNGAKKKKLKLKGN